MNFIIAGCHCCQSDVFCIVAGQSASSTRISDNDSFDTSTLAWTSRTDIVSPARVAPKGFSVQGVAYVVCGNASAGNIADNDSYVIDTWTSKTDCTATAIYTISGIIGNYGYVIPNVTGSNYEYDPSGNSWSTKATRISPAERTYPCSFSIGDYFYTAAGLSSGSSKETSRYESSGDSWSAMTEHLVAKQQGSGMAIDGNGYTFSGIGTEYDDLDEYSVAGDSWSAKSGNIVGAANGMAQGFRDDGYSVGGFDTTTGWSTANSKYTPATDSWASSSVTPSPARRLSACTTL